MFRAAAALVLVLAAAPAWAQAIFSGTVVGPDGLPVEGVTVIVTNVATSAQLEFTTPANGRFEFSGLAEGEYRVTSGSSAIGNFTVTLAAGERVDRELKIPFGPFREEWLVLPADTVRTRISSETRPGFRCSDRLIVNIGGVWQPFCNLSFMVDEFETGELARVAVFGPPRLVRAPNQTYPAALAEARAEGVVTLALTIAPDGSQRGLRVLSSDNPALNDAAIASVTAAAWNPARMRGAAVEVPITVTVTFRLEQLNGPRLPNLPQRVALQVVRVTPAEETARQMVFYKPSGPYRITGYTVRELIRFAYTLNDDRILGLPVWADSERFDIEQQWETEPTAGEVQALVRDMLALRFNLTTRVELRDFPGYGLIRFGGGGGSNIRPSTVDCLRQPPTGVAGVTPCQLRMDARGVYGIGMTMAQLAKELRDNSYTRVDRPVVDATGVSGAFDFELSLTRMERRVAPDGRVSMSITPSDVPLRTLLERELGLQLVERPVPQDVMVVDRVARPAAR